MPTGLVTAVVEDGGGGGGKPVVVVVEGGGCDVVLTASSRPEQAAVRAKTASPARGKAILRRFISTPESKRSYAS
jgi:hypothetical protein